MNMTPKRLIIIGFLLVLFGAAMPWFLILGYVESTFWLNFLIYGASVAGLIMGVMGAAMWSATRKKD